MRRMTMAIVIGLGLGLGGCGGKAAVQAPGHRGGVTGETLAAALAREVGAGHSVAIVGGSAGLRAVSSDGARQRTLQAAPVAWTLVDARDDVVWFGSADTTEIDAIDLDAPADRAIEVHAVVTGLPDGKRVAMVGPPRYQIVYLARDPDLPEGAAWMMSPSIATSAPWDMNRASVELAIADPPVLAGSSGYVQDAEWDAEVGKAVIRDRAFIAGLLARPQHAVVEDARPAETHVDGIDPANCEDAADCGKAEPIAGTHYWRVMTTNVMGDVRHIGWQLYDAGAHRLLEPEWATWFEGAWVAPDHSAFVVGGVVVRFDGGPLAATPADEAALGGGWLGGGTFYD